MVYSFTMVHLSYLWLPFLSGGWLLETHSLVVKASTCQRLCFSWLGYAGREHEEEEEQQHDTSHASSASAQGSAANPSPSPLPPPPPSLPPKTGAFGGAAQGSMRAGADKRNRYVGVFGSSNNRSSHTSGQGVRPPPVSSPPASCAGDSTGKPREDRKS